MQVVARERPAGSMTIIHTQKRKGAQAADAEKGRPAPDRAVANCLCCGKVYLCRETTNDTRLFVGAPAVFICNLHCPVRVSRSFSLVQIFAAEIPSCALSHHLLVE
jgi:hypothetical protein